MPVESEPNRTITRIIYEEECFLRGVYFSSDFKKSRPDRSKKVDIHPTVFRGKRNNGVSLYRLNYTSESFCVKHSKEGNNEEHRRNFSGFLSLDFDSIKEVKNLDLDTLSIETDSLDINCLVSPPTVIELVNTFEGDTSGLLSLVSTPMMGKDRIPPSQQVDLNSLSLPMHAEIFYLYDTSDVNPGEPRSALITALAKKLLKNACYKHIP